MALIEEDIFARPPRRIARATPVARITCRVCGKPATQTINTAGLLCSLCREDLDAIQRHVEEVRAKVEALFQEGLRGFDAVLGMADPADVTRYERVVEEQRKAVELGDGYTAKVERSIAKARVAGDGLSAILDAKAQLEEVSDRAGRTIDWARVALAEIAAARST